MSTTAWEIAVGVILLSSLTLASAAGGSPTDSVRDEIIISGSRESDAQLKAKAEVALKDDPYVFAEHVEIRVRDGVIILQGTVPSVQDLRRVLWLARRIAGRRRVVNRMELVIEDDVGTG
jgi:osmotically-inducible protein OsmY